MRRLGHDRVDVLGFSWGGGLAQQFAVTLAGKRYRKVDRDGGLADTALAGSDRDDRLHLGQQERTVAGSTAKSGRGAWR